jgi:hypothetical protein
MELIMSPQKSARISHQGEPPLNMKSQTSKSIFFAIMKLFFAILFPTGLSISSYESVALTMRHHPVELLVESPHMLIRQVIDSGIPTALTVDGIDHLVMVSADKYFQLLNQTPNIRPPTDSVAQK